MKKRTAYQTFKIVETKIKEDIVINLWVRRLYTPIIFLFLIWPCLLQTRAAKLRF